MKIVCKKSICVSLEPIDVNSEEEGGIQDWAIVWDSSPKKNAVLYSK